MHPCSFARIFAAHTYKRTGENPPFSQCSTIEDPDSLLHITDAHSRPRSAIGNVSDCRYVSDCRFKVCEFDPGPVSYFRGDYS